MSTHTVEKEKTRKLTEANAGPGDQTVAEILQPGTSSLDYYAENGSTTLNVAFFPSGQASATVQVDFGPQQPLTPGFKTFTFSRALQLFVNNQSGAVKYGWILVS